MSLKDAFEKHKAWVDSEGTEGEKAVFKGAELRKANLRRANLQGADLQNIDLEEMDLQGADLSEANLQNANLAKANLKGANLRESNLQDASLLEANLTMTNLQGADLQRADLRNADLSEAELRRANLLNAKLRNANFRSANLKEAYGVLASQLAGTNVSGAKLPEAVLTFECLKVTEEASKIAQNLFISVILGCAYSMLTIATTLDTRLLTNSVSSPLPILGTTIPIVSFYWLAPFILLVLYMYFHLYLQRLWEVLSELPAVFPDGRPLNKTVYPWLISGIARTHFRLLRLDRPPLSRLQDWIAIFLAWGAVPITLFLFLGRYLRRHDLLGTELHVVMLAASIGAGVQFYRLAAMTLSGSARTPFIWKKAVKDARALSYAMAIGIGIIFYILSVNAISNDIALMGYIPSANIESEDISSKPTVWTGKKDDELDLVIGAKLQDQDLSFLRARKAFLVKADLHQANLRYADLTETDLRRASLPEANLQDAILLKVNLSKATATHADFSRANLSEANLSDADLQSANFQDSTLKGTNFHGATLEGARFEGAKELGTADFNEAKLRRAVFKAAYLTEARLQKADLQETDLTKANLSQANLQEAQLQRAQLGEASLQKAHLQKAHLENASLPWADLRSAEFIEAQLQNADLSGANFRDANLTKANLTDANLCGASLANVNFQDATLTGADICGAEGITIGQFESLVTNNLVSSVHGDLDGNGSVEIINVYRRQVSQVGNSQELKGQSPLPLIVTIWGREGDTLIMRTAFKIFGDTLGPLIEDFKSALILRDLTGDGKPEIIVSSYDASNRGKKTAGVSNSIFRFIQVFSYNLKSTPSARYTETYLEQLTSRRTSNDSSLKAPVSELVDRFQLVTISGNILQAQVGGADENFSTITVLIKDNDSSEDKHVITYVWDSEGQRFIKSATKL